jgi:hypothetical protein
MMKTVLIGYFPKRTEQRPAWLEAVKIEEICSVSACISKGPEKWIDHWKHNEMWVFDSPALAWSVVPEAVREGFEVYAYGVAPVKISEGKEEGFDIPRISPEPLPDGFESLGFDIVCRSCGTQFECSPLSCNRLAEEIPTNRFCLLDDIVTALGLARGLDEAACEPGPYFVVEVFRQKRAAAAKN